MKNWQRYPEYKDSGVEWLGEIPKHWQVKRLKYIITEPLKYGANESAELNDKDCPRFIRITDIAEDGTLREETFRSLPHDIAKPFILKTGDILFARSGSTVGKTFMYREHWGIACYAGYLIRARLRLSKVLPEFISYFANSSVYWNWISSIFIQATIQNVSAEKYANLGLSTPPLSEQKSIAHFLDRETSKLDKLIAKKERFIELLQEKRTALISHAVTKGLNPDIPMKDSGISWLGQIPKHWDIAKLKYITEVISKGTTPTTIGAEFLDYGIRFLKAENISNGIITDKPAVFIDSQTNDTLRRSILKENDVLMVIAGATTGKTAIINYDCLPANTNQAVAFIRPKNTEISKFIFYWLNSNKINEQVWLLAVQAAQPNLSLQDIRDFIIPYPPIQEMITLIDYLDQETAKIDTLIEKTKTSIEKLKEYRTALISAAVTGKIDIREEI